MTNGRVTNLTGAEAALQRLALRLTTRRGSLGFAPEYGSRLHLLLREKPSARPALAAAYVQEAVQQERELTITAVELEQTGERGRLIVSATWQGESQTLVLEGVSG